MARNADISEIVKRFASELEKAVAQQVSRDFSLRFDDLRASILGGARRSPGSSGRSMAGRKAELKPCPICGERTKARRFSYLCEKHRTQENLRKFKGAAKKAAAAPVAAKTAAKAGGAKKAAKRKGKAKSKKASKTTEAAAS